MPDRAPPGRIDTHQHFVPPAYARWLERQGLTAGGLAIPPWSAAGALGLMDALGIRAAVVSISTPDVHLGDTARARAMAREVNKFAARLAADHPGRFGFFATLTLPDVDGALAELAHACDTLGADGVVLLANVQGIYLGDAAFEPLMDELDRRAAVVFVHPAQLPGPALAGLPPFAVDFLLDTTRAAVNMARRGWLDRYPRLRIILSHGGGFLPYAAERVAQLCSPLRDAADGLQRLALCTRGALGAFRASAGRAPDAEIAALGDRARQRLRAVSATADMSAR